MFPLICILLLTYINLLSIAISVHYKSTSCMRQLYDQERVTFMVNSRIIIIKVTFFLERGDIFRLKLEFALVKRRLTGL